VELRIALYALAVVIVAGSALTGLVLWSACMLSSQISRREEE
jgi:hypothetical protein